MASKAYVLIQVINVMEHGETLMKHADGTWKWTNKRVTEETMVGYDTLEDARDAASAAFDLLSLNREMKEDTDWSEFDEDDEAAHTMRRM